jgi:hypothetical protein
MVLGATIVTAVAASLVLLRVRGAGRLEPLAGTGRRRPRSHVTGLVVVTGLIYLNQVLFTVYVLREHGGDPSFIARYLPEGWFTLADGPVLESLARHVPAPELLAPPSCG